MTTTQNHPTLSPDDINVSLAAMTAVTIRVDRLCRVIERCAETNPIISRVAYTMAADSIQSIQARLNEPSEQNRDETGKFLHDITHQNLKTAEARIQNTKSPPQETISTTGQEPLFLSVEHAAISGQMSYHADQVQLCPNQKAKLAHIEAAANLRMAFEENLNNIRSMQPNQPDDNHRVALAIVTENAQTTIDTYHRIQSAKRSLLPVSFSKSISPQAKQQIQAQVDAFRKSDEPISCHLATVQSQIGVNTDHILVSIYEREHAIAINVIVAGDEYPPGTTQEEAISHANYIYQWGSMLLEEASTQEEAQIASAVISAAMTISTRAAAGLQATNLEQVVELVARAKELGIDAGTVRKMIDAIANGHHPFTDSIMEATDSVKITTNEQTLAIINAAESTGVPQGTINALITFMGFDPLNTGQPTTFYPTQQLDELAQLAFTANIPAENTVVMLTTTGITQQHASQIAVSAGYSEHELEEQFFTPLEAHFQPNN